MHIAVVAASQFEDTRTFLRTLAAQPGLGVSLLAGDADPVSAARVLRDAHRLWFEGTGPLLAHLASSAWADWLPGAQLRIGAGEVGRLPVPGVWRLVKTVFVPDAATAARVRALDPPPASARTRVALAGAAADRITWVVSQAGDLRSGEWRAIYRLAEGARGRVRIIGDAPPELATVLATAYGREVVTSGPADTRILWHTPAEASILHVVPAAEDVDDALPLGPPPDPEAGDWPLVSVIVPVYNGQDTIDRCLDGLRRQTYPNLEILVINDGSTDATADRVAKHLNDSRVRYFDKPHSGRPDTRNRGIAEARGDWIAWLDADDESMPNRIRAQVLAARAAGGADVVHADGLLLWPTGQVTFTRRGRHLPCEELGPRLLDGLAGICPVLNTSTLVRPALYERLGGYDAAFQRGQDYEFWCRCAAAGDVRFVHVPVPLVIVHRATLTDTRRDKLVTSSLQLARRLVELMGEDALVDPVARDLHDPPAMTVGRVLLRVGLGSAHAGHPIFDEADAYLRRGLSEAGGASYDEASRMLEILADHRRGRHDDPEPSVATEPPVATAHAEP